jgi:hypothetical protein
MGGLISLYGFFRNSETFGVAGVMSPALWFAQRAIFDYVEAAERLPGKVYLDIGTREGEETLADARRMRDAPPCQGLSAPDGTSSTSRRAAPVTRKQRGGAASGSPSRSFPQAKATGLKIDGFARLNGKGSAPAASLPGPSPCCTRERRLRRCSHPGGGDGVRRWPAGTR